MKKIVFTRKKCVLLIPILLFTQLDIWAQCHLSTQLKNNRALGDAAKFIITSQNAINSNLPVNSQKQTALLYMACTTDSLQWLETTIYVDFNPSSANYIDVLFRCDSLLQNGWLIRLGDVDDGIKLIQRSGGKERIDCAGESGYFNKSKSNITLRWVKQRDQFLLLYKDSSWESYKTLCGSVDTLPYHYKFSGLAIIQTGSGAAGKHRVEMFTVTPPHPDKTPPTIQFLQWKSPSTAEIQFSEPIVLQNKNQLICQYQQAIAYTQPNSRTLIAQFNSQPCNQPQTVYVQNAQDSAGNIQPLQQKTAFVYCETPVEPFEVTITEIMADPFPNRGFLPPVQYIELKNNTQKSLWLSELHLSDLHSTNALPNVLLSPQMRVTLCRFADTPLMKSIPRVVGCNLPYLNIETETLTLTNQQNQIVHRFQYHQYMHHPSYRDGGYSLEHIDSLQNCLDLFQWQSNTALGGTPSQPPVKFQPYPTSKPTPPPTQLPFSIAYLAATHPDTAVIAFTHPIQGQLPRMRSKLQENQYTFTPQSNNQYHIAPPLKNGQAFTVLIDSALSCNGETITNVMGSLCYVESVPLPGELQFNEVMFNSLDHLSDFVEIVNTSQKPLQLMGLQLKIQNNPQPEEIVTLSNQPYTLYPGEIRCFSVQSYPLARANNPQQVFNHQTVPNFPNLPAAGATLQLLHPLGTTIDEMVYRETMHTPILNSTKGVSLEKTSPTAPSNQSMHWVSATATAGNSTPAETNSQCSQLRKSTAKAFQLEKMVYQFQNDEHIVLLHQLPKAGYVVKVSLFSMMGSIVPIPIPATQVSQDGQLLIPLWEIKQTLPSGNYILHIDAFHADADICRQNLRLVLVH
ncbi:MAG: hypothetical protein RLZZ504_252 [Bacteroidota bacterium]